MPEPQDPNTDDYEIINAAREDAEHLAILINYAGEGMPKHYWQGLAAPGQSPLEVGIDRAQREQGDFSYKNARLLKTAAATRAVCISFPLADPYDMGDLLSQPAYIRPLIELEARAPGSWYINVLATYPEHRGKGHATALLKDSFTTGRTKGHQTASLIVASENTPACKLYESLGFKKVANAPIIPIPDLEMKGNWLLLEKALTR